MNIAGVRVAESRRLLKLTQDQLCAGIADATNGKWIPTRRDIYRIESGTRIVSDLELVALAIALGRDTEWLLFREGDKANNFSENIFRN